MSEMIPKKIFDQEYATQIREEYEYLKNLGFKCSYMRREPKYGVMTYKYTKTAALFKAVAAYYEQRENTRSMEAAKAVADTSSARSVVLDATDEEVDAMFARFFDRSRSGLPFTTDDLPQSMQYSLASLAQDKGDVDA